MPNAFANESTQSPLALVCGARDGVLRAEYGVVEWTFRVDRDAQHRMIARWIDSRTCESLATQCIENDAPGALGLLRDLIHAGPTRPGTGPDHRWAWIGSISYEFGRTIEPKATCHTAHAPSSSPLIEFHRVRTIDSGHTTDPHATQTHDLKLSPATDAQRHDYIRDVDRIRDYIRAGDIYQANLTTPLQGVFTGNSRELFADLAQRSRPWHGVYIEGSRHEDNLHQRAMLSFSPELFLKYDASTRVLTTRPMKGTRSGTDDTARKELLHSAKDKAELAMIVDLMRNDLSRVCEVGTVGVPRSRDVEQHSSGVWQATAEVRGTLCEKYDIFDAIAATFPGGSVTGAPKIRAMQIIEELERRERGPYCGCAGIIHDDGSAQLNLSIRTLTLEQPSAGGLPYEFASARATYQIGSGIVYRSDPQTEWDETIAKAMWLLRAQEQSGTQ